MICFFYPQKMFGLVRAVVPNLFPMAEHFWPQKLSQNTSGIEKPLAEHLKAQIKQ